MTTQTAVQIVDALGNRQSMKAEIDGQGVLSPHQVPEVGGLPVSTTNPMPTFGVVGLTLTMRIVSLTANTDALLAAANPARRYLSMVALTGGDVWLNFGSNAVVAAGWPLPAPAAEAKRGEPFEMADGMVTLQAVHGISDSAATVVVLEG